jgi:hypothetical protein
MVEELAEALGDLRDEMIFIGGAILSVYIDDPAADEVRPTTDIDLTINILNTRSWEKLQEKLSDCGIYPDPFGHSICSYKFKDIAVDIMQAEDSPLSPSNKWYKHRFNDIRTIQLIKHSIKVLAAPCYLATKFEAFNGRGKDYRTSHDFEDILFILDNRSHIAEEIMNAPIEIKQFLQSELKKLVTYPFYDEVLSSHIHPYIQNERIPMLKDKIDRIISGQ